jgi:hypothetical protein
MKGVELSTGNRGSSEEEVETSSISQGLKIYERRIQRLARKRPSIDKNNRCKKDHRDRGYEKQRTARRDLCTHEVPGPL